jgi:hypothetical protein
VVVDLAKAAHLVALMVGPTVAVGAVVWTPALVRALRRRRARRARESARPAGRPIERIAADLRRLLAEYEQVSRSTGVAVRARHLAALRGALTDCVLEAARALDVPAPTPPRREPLPVPELARMLRALDQAGVVIPGHERFGRHPGGA